MAISTKLNVGEVNSCSVGELLCIRHNDAQIYALRLENGDGPPMLGVIYSPDEQPRLLQVYADQTCLRFGTDWVIEPRLGNTAAPYLHETAWRSGLLVLSVEGWRMNFATSGVDTIGRFSAEWRDLSRFETVSPDRSYVSLFDSWDLWLSASDQQSAKQPLISFVAVSTRR